MAKASSTKPLAANVTYRPSFHLPGPRNLQKTSREGASKKKLGCGDLHRRNRALFFLAAPLKQYAAIAPSGYTTAPPVSSFSLIGFIKSSRFTPSHIATAAATNTDE